MSRSIKKYDLWENYKIRWPSLRILPGFLEWSSQILLNALNVSFETGQYQSISQRRGIVKLIPKKDAELVLIKNWRPLTLLNFDYKIASKAIASRIKTFLPKLISDDQTGFLKGRCISENIRLLDSVIKYYTEGRNIPGLLLFNDLGKAFDTLEWPCISKRALWFRALTVKLDWTFIAILKAVS